MWHQLDGNMIAADAHYSSAEDHNEGDTCAKCGEGVLEWKSPESCSCHVAPPCGHCEAEPLRCSACGETG